MHIRFGNLHGAALATALAATLSACLAISPARAAAPYFEILPSADFLTSAQQASFVIHLVGTLDPIALQNASVLTDGHVLASLKLDGAPLTSLLLAFYIPNGQGGGDWQYPAAWETVPRLLPAGTHSLVAQYRGDASNPPLLTEFSFTVVKGLQLEAGGLGLVLAPYAGVLPGVLPVGEVTLTEKSTGKVQNVDIATLLEPGQLGQGLRLKLPDGLADDTLVTYPGDANFPALSYTYDARDVPEPAGLLPLGALGAILAARRRAIRPA